jgi:basic amino acid/polyamine antiporter, APA family
MSDFKRSLSFNSTIAIVVGGVIGSGIFMKPAIMASLLGSPLLLLSIWVVAGIITLFGALSNAELASMFPETGGQYVFFQKIYGQGFAFLYGWASFAVINTAGNASIAWVCSQYLDYFFDLPSFSESIEQSVKFSLPGIGIILPLQHIGLKAFTVLIVLLFSIINYYSVRYGSGLQRFLTVLKAAAIVMIVGGIFFSGEGSANNFFISTNEHQNSFAAISACMAAMAGAFWAYDGWNNITFVAGEIKDPQKNIPKSLFIGIIFCILVYFLINLAYLYVLPIHKMAGSAFIASDAAVAAFGAIGGSIIALLVIVSTLGTANSNILSTARVTFVMCGENRLLSWGSKVQPKYRTPGNALLLNFCWSFILIFSGSFDMLTDMLIFVSWFFYGMSALGVIILRIKQKQLERPFKVPGYPFLPAIFVTFTFAFLVLTLMSDIEDYHSGKTHIINSVLGISITLAGLPLLFWQKKTIDRKSS